MQVGVRPKRTTAELIDLINQRHADWWPEHFTLTIDRSAEHDWIAIVESGDESDRQRRADFAASLGRVVAELRLRNAWAGY